LSDHILNCAESWYNSDNHKIDTGPFVIVCQSSGYGKTKSLYEFASRHITLFTCMRNSNTNGYPSRSYTADILNNAITQGTTINFLISYIQTTLDFIDEMREKKQFKNKNEQDFASSFRFCQQWVNCDENGLLKSLQYEFIEALNKNISNININKSNLNEKINDLRMKISTTLKFDGKTVSALTFVIDEAHYLIEKTEIDSRSQFRHLRQCIRTHLTDIKIVFVLTSTCSSIFDFHVGKNNLSPSDRISEKKAYPPFCELNLCNQLRPDDYEAKLINYCQVKNRSDLYDFIYDRDPFETIFYYGRPLWASYLQAIKKEKKIQDLIL
jgi:hypothetical protein